MGSILKLGFSKTLDAWLENLSKTGRSSKQAVSVLVDGSLTFAALWAAYSLRLNRPYSDFDATWHLFVLMPVVSVLIIASLGIYRWVVRSSNRALFFQLGKACLVSAMVLVIFSYLFPSEGTNPRSVFIIYGLLLAVGTFSARVLWQSIFDTGRQGEPVAVYGAGEAGSQLVQLLYQGHELRPVLIIDDNPLLKGTTICGVMVRCPGDLGIGALLEGHEIGRVIMALPSVSADEYQSKVSAISRAGVTVQTIPTYAELVSGRVKVDEVRDISINDILGRSEVPPNPELLGRTVSGKVVMVTGAGGSIGAELCRQIALQNPRKLIALDHSEENLYQITEEITRRDQDSIFVCDDFVPVLGSVNDAFVIREQLETYEVDTIFHAAAYKHVPIVEAQPEQGVQVNIFGTLAVLESAIEHKIENFVLISTDKAVRPTNSMGATKRVAELILQAKSKIQTDTKISMVRFGNVLGSSGSVVPKFKKQIESGGPITLTDPDVTRYFMTIPEAAQLVLQASAIAKGGDVFVLDMGEPVRIEDLAISMVRMSGKQLRRDTGNHSDIDIVIEGLRPGEKMYEELFISDTHAATIVPKIFTASEHYISWRELSGYLEELSFYKGTEDREKLRNLLLDLAFYQLSPVPSEPSALPRESEHRTESAA